MGKVNHFLYFDVIFDLRFKFDYIKWSFNNMYRICSELAKKNLECVKISLFKLSNLYKSDHDKNVEDDLLNEPLWITSLGETSPQSKSPPLLQGLIPLKDT